LQDVAEVAVQVGAVSLALARAVKGAINRVAPQAASR
jgi:hypothetical protein